MFTAVPMAVLGAPVESYLLVGVVKQVVDHFQHSMVGWRYGWIGRWLIYSPVGHRIHHSKMEEHWDLNYGNIIPLWDRIFGTWYAGDQVNAEVDVTDNFYNQGSPVKEFFHCANRFFSCLIVSIRTNNWLMGSEERFDLLLDSTKEKIDQESNRNSG